MQPSHPRHGLPPRGKALCIDADLLERMGMLARLNPGATISLARAQARRSWLKQKVTLHVDGVAADEVVLPTMPTPLDSA